MRGSPRTSCPGTMGPVPGRMRRAGSAVERARLNVTRALRSAIAYIGTVDRALGRHLDETIRTGTWCSYTPDPRIATVWQT